ncbi:LysR family transcriptional regulator [Beijerinckiaceae bacterium]|nr:LysR family transcriptional regulator [Beijerinckiaceae bacterium]
MELYQIMHFIAVVETGSFTKGADRAAVSQPAISASIARLEAEFDVQLLDRRRSPIAPTIAGERLFEAGKAILHVCNAVKGDLAAIARPKLLRIGILQSLSSRQVSRLLGSFKRTYPQVAIEMFDGVCDQLIGMLADRQVDTILTIFDEYAAKFPSRVLFEEPYSLAVPEGHRYALRKSVKLADLNDEPLIVRTRCDRYQEVTDLLVARGVKLRVVYQTDQDDRALALVAAGVGIALVPAHFEVPSVKQVPVSDLGLSRAIGLLWSRERENDLKEFIKFAECHCWTQ